ncbi:MAG: methyltransferase domain-containing protein [Melioribacteraceae bacterium]|nr:methyltransferase domain-containing protein [Melioribacteraceae bacterium]
MEIENRRKWNARYSSDEYFFGKEPNEFLKQEIGKIMPGKILFVGDGEGRNSVHAARLGWDVDAIDISDVAKSKALKLADEHNVKVNYIVGDAIERDYEQYEYDAIAIIYFHVKKEDREEFDKKMINSLKPDGTIIILVYEIEHINNGSGGPQSEELLYSLSDIAENFIDLEFNLFVKEHFSRVKNNVPQESTVIKFVGKKPKLS